MNTGTTNSETRAACVTPPGAGGIAVVQVVGPDLATVLSPLLKTRRPLDICHFDASELRLCRVSDGNEVIDDAILAVRRTTSNRMIADLNLHGGPRIVQRVLMALQQEGARIVSPDELAPGTWDARSVIERECLAVLPKTPTLAVACWLLACAERVPVILREAIRTIEAGDLPKAKALLEGLLPEPNLPRRLLDGVRVVVAGEPNVGKSTLVNALCERDHAIVSETPGTTRDWVEHRSAVDGIPFTFVDTAGVRETNDAIEAEAIARARRQVETADILLQVMDLSADSSGRSPDAGLPQTIVVWNKVDLLAGAAPNASLAAPAPPRVMVSAANGTCLDELRQLLLERAGLTGWRNRYLLVGDAQQQSLTRALSGLDAGHGLDAQRDLTGLL